MNQHANWYDKNYYDKNHQFESQWYEMTNQILPDYIKGNNRVLELGCGISDSLIFLVKKKFVLEKNIYGIDQSKGAIKKLQKYLPSANLVVGDIHRLNYPDNYFDIIIMLEVIEHLKNPYQTLREISRLIKNQGYLFLSFPNFTVFPWNVARIISDRLSLPQLINKQPIDNIYSVREVIAMATKVGFKKIDLIGITYLTAVFRLIESWQNYFITRKLNNIGLSQYSLHPLIIFQKQTY